MILRKIVVVVLVWSFTDEVVVNSNFNNCEWISFMLLQAVKPVQSFVMVDMMREMDEHLRPEIEREIHRQKNPVHRSMIRDMFFFFEL